MYFESTQHDINFQLDHKTKSYLFMSLKGKYYDMVSIEFNRSCLEKTSSTTFKLQ